MSRVCIVTGSTRGIGRGIAESLRSNDYEVVGLARSPDISADGRFITCDITDEASVEDACREIASLGEIWALVNNAGFAHSDPIEKVAFADMHRVFMANTFSPAMFTRAAVPNMKDGGHPR